MVNIDTRAEQKVAELLVSKKAMIGVATALMLAILVPLVASAATTTTTVSSEIGSTINLLTSSSTVNLDSTPTESGVQTIASDTVTVSTNNADGYTLQISETTAETDLTSDTDAIPATTGTFASPIASRRMI